MAKPDIIPGGGVTEESVAEGASNQGRIAFFTHIAGLTKRAVGGDGDAQTELRTYSEELSALVNGLPPAAGGEGLQASSTAAPASGQPASQG